MSLPPIIAFTGLAQSGKTLAASFFTNAERISLADPLKAMLKVLTSDSDKNVPQLSLCGKTLRYALQTLGTEWGRNMIGENLWVEHARQRIRCLLEDNWVQPSNTNLVTIDDVRFDGEAEMVRNMGGIIIHIRRPGIDKMSHASEQGIDPALVDFWVTAETPEELACELQRIGLLEPTQQTVFADE